MTALATRGIEPGCVVQHQDGRLGLCYRVTDGFVYVSTPDTDREWQSRCWPLTACARDGDTNTRHDIHMDVQALLDRIEQTNLEALA